MSGTASVLQQALALDEQGRAEVASELLASLDDGTADDPAQVDSLWAEELGRRARRAASSPEESEDWSVVRQRVLDDLAE